MRVDRRRGVFRAAWCWDRDSTGWWQRIAILTPEGVARLAESSFEAYTAASSKPNISLCRGSYGRSLCDVD